MDENIHELQKKLEQNNSLNKWPLLITKDTDHYNKTEEHDAYVMTRKPALHHDSTSGRLCTLAKAEGQSGYRRSHLSFLFPLVQQQDRLLP